MLDIYEITKMTQSANGSYELFILLDERMDAWTDRQTDGLTHR